MAVKRCANRPPRSPAQPRTSWPDRLRAARTRSPADRVHASAGNLRQDEAWLADLLDDGGRQLGSLAETLKGRDVGSLIATLERFARREPAVFAAISVALGFATARLAKSTAERPREPDDASVVDADQSEAELEEQATTPQPKCHRGVRSSPAWATAIGQTQECCHEHVYGQPVGRRVAA
jgi:hypothetical protein